MLPLMQAIFCWSDGFDRFRLNQTFLLLALSLLCVVQGAQKSSC